MAQKKKKNRKSKSKSNNLSKDAEELIEKHM